MAFMGLWILHAKGWILPLSFRSREAVRNLLFAGSVYTASLSQRKVVLLMMAKSFHKLTCFVIPKPKARNLLSFAVSTLPATSRFLNG
jgi:hypothetical protein